MALCPAAAVTSAESPTTLTDPADPHRPPQADVVIAKPRRGAPVVNMDDDDDESVERNIHPAALKPIWRAAGTRAGEYQS